MARRNIHGRLQRLEASVPEPPKPPSRDFLSMRAILDELGALKSSCAVYWRGGVEREPENIPGKILGAGYTQRDLHELAAKRALAARGEPESEVPRCLEALKVIRESRRDDWDEPVEWERGGRG